MKFMYFIDSDILLKQINFIYNRFFFAAITHMVSVTSASRYIASASRYHPRFQSMSSMCIRGLSPRNFSELAMAVPID